MAPARPIEVTRDRKVMSFFGGAVLMEPLSPDPGRCCKAQVTFKVHELPPVPEAAKPLMFHFHPYQEEYFQIVAGSATVVIEGKCHVLTASSEEFVVPRMATHGIFPTEGCDEDLILLGSSEDTGEPYQLDITFFENWWQYQTELLKYGSEPSLIQILAMWDAGDCAIPLPSWIPFAKPLARLLGIILGRWIGGALGYQPFYKQWTTDWDSACRKMSTCFFQRRFGRNKEA